MSEPVSNDVAAPRRGGVAAAFTSDTALIVLTATIILGGVLLQLFSPEAGKKGIGVMVSMLGLFLALSRHLLSRISRNAEALDRSLSDSQNRVVATTAELTQRVDGLTRTVGMTPESLAQDSSLSPLASKIWQAEAKSHRERYNSFSSGSVLITGAEPTVAYLKRLTEYAETGIDAVDHVHPEQWFADSSLRAYLRFQLARVRSDGITLERIRVVREDHLRNGASKDALVRLVREHEGAGARILLCFEEDVRRLGTDFFPPKGMLLIDRATHPTCLAGRLGPQGFIEAATVSFKLVGPAHTTVEDYDRIRDLIARDDLDAVVRARLGSV